MAAADLNLVLASPGNLCVNPTDLSLPFPHGGTALGSVREPFVDAAPSWFDVTAEEYGGQVVESIFCGESFLIRGFLRYDDPDALSTLNPNTKTGARSKAPGIRHWLDAQVAGDTTFYPGMKASDRAVKLLFSPLDTSRSKAVLLYRALPRAEVSSVPRAFGGKVERPFLFLAIPDSTLRVYRDDFLVELAL